MKRSRGGGSITGGTGDVKPQIITLTTGFPTTVATYSVNKTTLPVPRFGSQKNMSTITEILWVDWYIQMEGLQDAATTGWAFLSTTLSRSDGDTATLASLVLDLEDPRTFALAMVDKNLTTSGATAVIYPIHIDLTDNNGNGLLIAVDSLVAIQGNVANATNATAVAKIGYRLVNVGLDEYIGIVQSQQQ